MTRASECAVCNERVGRVSLKLPEHPRVCVDCFKRRGGDLEEFAWIADRFENRLLDLIDESNRSRYWQMSINRRIEVIIDMINRGLIESFASDFKRPGYHNHHSGS